MSGQDWLSLEEIAQLWSDETGESEEEIERDLDAWFTDFLARQPTEPSETPEHGGAPPNVLMGMLGGRHLQREIFAIYCEETGRAKPIFWFPDGAEDSEAEVPPPSDPDSVARLQALHGFAPEAGRRQPAPPKAVNREYEQTRPIPKARRADWAPPAHKSQSEIKSETATGTSDAAERRPPPDDYWATPETESPSPARAALAAVWRALGRFLPYLAQWLLAMARALLRAGGALLRASRGLPGGKATQLAGGAALGLALVAAVFVLWPGEPEPTQLAPMAAEQEATPQALVSALRRELATALQTIASLEQEALQASAVVSDTARREQTLAMQAASAHAALLGRDLDAARGRIADLQAQVQAAGAEAALRAKQLAAVRKAHQEDLEKLRAAAEEPASEPAAPAALAVSGTAKATAASVAPQDATLETAKLETAVARPTPVAAAPSVDVDSLVTSPGRYDSSRVVVTGSLFRLLQQYRLESRLGRSSLLVDVTGLHRTQHDLLQQAMAGTGVMSTVRAQISGKVVRGPSGSYRLLATDLVLVE